jgi:integrase
LFEDPTRFLNKHYVQSGSTPSPHSWHKAAYSLKSWFQYLQAVGCDWPDAGEQHREDYRDDYLTAISPKTGRPYGTAGVRDSITVIRKFHQFCTGLGKYHGDIGGIVETEGRSISLDRDALAHIRSGGGTLRKDRALPKVRPGIKIHPMRVCDLKALLHHIGPQASDRLVLPDRRPARNRLIYDLGWAVGLRLDEINSLTTLQFLSLCPDRTALFANMVLTIKHGKGNKTRLVAIPTWLVIDALAYIDGEREESLKACKAKSKNSPLRLLLTHAGAKNAGKPISNGAIQKMFREACFALGMVEIVEKTNPENGNTSQASIPLHSMHDLRHTYAVLTYHAERANGNAEPWKKIQAQLGHSHLQTTIDTYLSHVDIFTDQPGLLDVRRMIGL